MANDRLLFQLLAAGVFCTVLFGAIELLSMAVVDVLFLILLFSRSLPKLSSAFLKTTTISSLLPSFLTVTTSCDLFTSHRTSKGSTVPSETFNLWKEVRFENVSYSYPASDNTQHPPAISSLSIQIPSGAIVLLRGHSGAGKSTVADILLGLLSPSSGQILLDGADLHTLDLDDWRNSIAYVSNSPFIFEGTLEENLRWSNTSAAEEELWEALKWAAAERFVKDTPKALQETIDSAGRRFSTGERQRIAIARALIRKPSLLILDEATAAIDADNEEHIIASVSKHLPDTSVFIVSHRDSILKSADIVYELENGLLV